MANEKGLKKIVSRIDNGSSLFNLNGFSCDTICHVAFLDFGQNELKFNIW
jgi:hypothetical protein